MKRFYALGDHVHYMESPTGVLVKVSDTVAKLNAMKKEAATKNFSRDPEVFQAGYLLALDEVLRLLGE